MVTPPPASLHTREHAEVERSRAEAQSIRAQSLKSSGGLISRYLNATADTPYPLEFAHYLAGDVGGKRVLDFGCGTGANSLLLAARGAQVTGIDISLDLVALARARMSNAGSAVGGAARFLTASAHSLPFADGTFHLVFGVAILHHLDLALVSREVHRLLAPGGRAIFLEPVRNSRLIEALREWYPIQRQDISPFERPLRSPEIEQFAAPFSSFRTKAFTLPHVRIARHLGITKRVDALYRLDSALLRRYPRLELYTAVRIIELRK